MNIIQKNDYRAEIVLTDSELDELDITYDELDYGNVETRRVLWTLLDRIRKNCGTELDLSGKLLIEASREPDGNCRISFTSLPPRNADAPSVRQLIKTSARPVCAEFGNIDDTVNAAVHSCFEGKSALYEKNGAYRLLFFCPSELRRSLCAAVGEYGELLCNADGQTQADCEEGWRLIEAESAAEILKRLE